MAHLPVDDTAADFIAAAEETQAHTIEVCRWWQDAGIDVLMTPTVPYPALPLVDMVDDPADPMRIVRRTIRTFTFAAPFNTTGEPAISLPLHHSPDGLPVGVQLVAPHGREDVLLQLAAQLERAHPWHHRQPPTHSTPHRSDAGTTPRA
jgi:amidase